MTQSTLSKLARALLTMTALTWGALGLAACGDESSSSSSSFSCCINGSYYSCESADAVQKCGNSDFSGCTRDSSKDAPGPGESCKD